MEKELIKFNISAPGRIVLSGEHSAIYGKNVVVASVNLRTKLEFIELYNIHNRIILEFPRVHLNIRISCRIIEDYFFNRDISDITANPLYFFQYITNFITKNRLWKTHEQRYSLQIFFYMFYYLTRDFERRSPFCIYIITDVPYGTGLGNSTSFAVCLAACFLHWKCLKDNGIHNEFNIHELELIENYSKSCEAISLNTFSMIDAKISLYGGVRIFRQRNFEDFNEQVINLRANVEILVFTLFSKQTAEERAQQMATWQFNNTEKFNSLLNTLDELAITIYNILERINITDIEDPNFHQAYIDLQNQIINNQKLLNDNGLSHPSLDKLSLILDKFSLKAKLTGFGGKFAYTVLQPKFSNTEKENIKKRLKKNYNITIANIGVEGLRIDN